MQSEDDHQFQKSFLFLFSPQSENFSGANLSKTAEAVFSVMCDPSMNEL
jgi:hypothetical protein